MKLLFFIPVWRRPEILKIFVSKLNFPSYCQSKVLFILSPKDPEYKANQKLISGHEIFITPNDFLGKKKNNALNFALSNYDFDYLIEFGSDNIWLPVLWEIYKPYFKNHEKYFGVNNIYIFEINKNKAILLRNYHEGNALGVGRVISRKVIEKCLPLWRSDWVCGMDGCSNFQIENNGFKNTVIDTNNDYVLLDVKSETNLTGFWELEDKGEIVYVELLKKAFGITESYSSEFFRTIEIKEFHAEVEKRTQVYRKKKDAFNSVNSDYLLSFGENRFKNYGSYQSYISKKYREWRNE